VSPVRESRVAPPLSNPFTTLAELLVSLFQRLPFPRHKEVALEEVDEVETAATQETESFPDTIEETERLMEQLMERYRDPNTSAQEAAPLIDLRIRLRNHAEKLRRETVPAKRLQK
jgi:hypothetical protein